MSEQNSMAQLRYLEELGINLRRSGFEVKQIEDQHLPVHWNGGYLCRVSGKGSVLYRGDVVDALGALAELERVIDTAKLTAEYMTMMETAPRLKAQGLEGDYRILADFGGTVLAGHPTECGTQFVTWDWDFDRKGVSHGHYFQGNYEGAKQDFAARSGLVPKDALFQPEQLIEIYRCCADALNYCLDMTAEQEKCIKGVQEQIKNGMPDIMERIRQQDLQVMEHGEEELHMKQTF